MLRICAWCLVRIDEADGGDPTPTHGICPPCRTRLEREWDLLRAGRLPPPPYRERLATVWRRARRRIIVTLGRWARETRER
jgi:hypothetical protein